MDGLAQKSFKNYKPPRHTFHDMTFRLHNDIAEESSSFSARFAALSDELRLS